MIRFKWIKFWHVGEHLRMFSNNEEYQRTAVGRYYYPCYLIARDIYNNTKGRKSYSKISHKSLIRHFTNSESEEDQNIGLRLKELRKIRNNADYDAIFRYDSTDAMSKSKELLNMLENMRKMRK